MYVIVCIYVLTPSVRVSPVFASPAVVASGQGVSDQAVRREQEPGGAEPAPPAVPAGRGRGGAARRRRRVRGLGQGTSRPARRLHLGARGCTCIGFNLLSLLKNSCPLS